MKQFIIAHDIGTSGDKATLFAADGTLIRSVTTSYSTHFFQDTWAEQNPQDWWNAFCAGNHLLLKGIDKTQVAGVSFSGQMMGCVVLDQQGHLLRPAIIWSDQRAQKAEKLIKDRISEKEFYHLTGHRISASYSAEKLMWIKENEPDIYCNIYKMIQPKDYLVYRLTGKFITDYSDASGTNVFDLNRMCWSEKLLDLMDIDGDLLPEVKASTFIAGEITDSIAEESGLGVGTAVVIGAGDGVCAAVGAGSIENGDTFNYLGSSSWIATTSDRPVFDPQMRTYNWAHMVPGKISPNGTMQAAGNSYSFMKKIMCQDLTNISKEHVYELMNRETVNSPVGAKGLIYLPYILGERSPRWNSKARGAFVGLKMEHERGDLLRATLEGVILNLCIILDIFRAEMDISSLNVIGGLANGQEIRSMLANIYGLPVKKLKWLEEATSMGAAVAAGVGTGLLKGFDEVHKFNQAEDCIKPEENNVRLYQELKPVFEETYQALRPVYEHLYEVGKKERK